MLNDARVASLGFLKDNICSIRINKEKKFKIKFQVLLKFAQILLDYYFRSNTYYKNKFISYLAYQLHYCTLSDKRCLSQGMYLNQVMMSLHLLNDVANDAESKQKSKITSLSLV